MAVVGLVTVLVVTAVLIEAATVREENGWTEQCHQQ